MVPVPVDLSNLGDVVKTDLLRNIYIYIYNAKIRNIKDKIPDFTNLATTTTTLNAKINEVKNKIPNIDNLATTTALTVGKNKIPNDSNLVKETAFNTKIGEMENKITSNRDHH